MFLNITLKVFQTRSIGRAGTINVACTVNIVSAVNIVSTVSSFTITRAQQQPRSLATRKTKDAGLCTTIWRAAF